MKDYNNYNDYNTEEREYVIQETYYNEEDVPEEIEQTRNDYTRTNHPYDYSKEERFTTVYKIPNNWDNYEYRFNTGQKRKNKCKCCRCCNCDCNSKIEGGYGCCTEREVERKRYNISPSYNSNYLEREGERKKYNISSSYNSNYTEREVKRKKYNISPSYNSNHSKNLTTLYNYDTITTNHGYYEGKSPQHTYSSRTQYRKYNINKSNNINKISPIKPKNMRYIGEEKYKNSSIKNTNDNSRGKYNNENTSKKYTNENYSNKYTNENYRKKNVNENYRKKYVNENYSEKYSNENYSEKYTNENSSEKYTNEYYPKKYTNSQEIKGGRIENYFENDISQDGKYVVSMTLSKKIMDEDELKKIRGKYRNNYYKEEIEVDDNDGEKEFEEKKSTINSRIRDYGDNYKYFERNENKSPLKATKTHQRRRQPYHVYGNECYETNEEVKRYKIYPRKSQKLIRRYYKEEDGDYEETENKNYDNDDYDVQEQYNQYPSEYDYKKEEYQTYDY